MFHISYISYIIFHIYVFLSQKKYQASSRMYRNMSLQVVKYGRNTCHKSYHLGVSCMSCDPNKASESYARMLILWNRLRSISDETRHG